MKSAEQRGSPRIASTTPAGPHAWLGLLWQGEDIVEMRGVSGAGVDRRHRLRPRCPGMGDEGHNAQRTRAFDHRKDVWHLRADRDYGDFSTGRRHKLLQEPHVAAASSEHPRRPMPRTGLPSEIPACRHLRLTTVQRPIAPRRRDQPATTPDTASATRTSCQTWRAVSMPRRSVLAPLRRQAAQCHAYGRQSVRASAAVRRRQSIPRHREAYDCSGRVPRSFPAEFAPRRRPALRPARTHEHC